MPLTLTYLVEVRIKDGEAAGDGSRRKPSFLGPAAMTPGPTRTCLRVRRGRWWSSCWGSGQQLSPEAVAGHQNWVDGRQAQLLVSPYFKIR